MANCTHLLLYHISKKIDNDMTQIWYADDVAVTDSLSELWPVDLFILVEEANLNWPTLPGADLGQKYRVGQLRRAKRAAQINE